MSKYRDEYGEPLVWTTRDGRDLTIEEMGTSHLRSVCGLLERHGAHDGNFEAGDLPFDHEDWDLFTAGVERAVNDTIPPLYKAIKEELKTRSK